MRVHVLTLILAAAIALSAGAAIAKSDQATAEDKDTQATEAAKAETPNAVLPQPNFEFEPVVDGTEVTHNFPIKNTGKGGLAIKRVKTG